MDLSSIPKQYMWLGIAFLATLILLRRFFSPVIEHAEKKTAARMVAEEICKNALKVLEVDLSMARTEVRLTGLADTPRKKRMTLNFLDTHPDFKTVTRLMELSSVVRFTYQPDPLPKQNEYYPTAYLRIKQ